jgi:hypothetical protein
MPGDTGCKAGSGVSSALATGRPNGSSTSTLEIPRVFMLSVPKFSVK